jgi:DNA polymerase I
MGLGYNIPMSKLVVIDGNAILHRAFHAIPPLTTPNGEPINAVYGLVSMILKLVQDLRPTHLVVAFDEKAPTFRKKAFKAYQAQRPETDEGLSSQFEKARKFLAAAKIPVYSKSGYEADDVIGTLATLATKTEDGNLKHEKKNEGRSLNSDHASKFNNQSSSLSSDIKRHTSFDEVVIVTGDRDILQLVDDKKNIKLFMPVGGIINGKIFGEAETIERMGVIPALIPDLKALTGDASDNYLGVRGIGPKTAEKLLNEYKGVNTIYSHLDDIEPKTREKLLSGRDDAKLFHYLATIVCDVPITFDFGQMEKWNLGSPEVLNLFTEEFGFRTLTTRIKKFGEEKEKEQQTSLF